MALYSKPARFTLAFKSVGMTTTGEFINRILKIFLIYFYNKVNKFIYFVNKFIFDEWFSIWYNQKQLLWKGNFWSKRR